MKAHHIQNIIEEYPSKKSITDDLYIPDLDVIYSALRDCPGSGPTFSKLNIESVRRGYHDFLIGIVNEEKVSAEFDDEVYREYKGSMDVSQDYVDEIELTLVRYGEAKRQADIHASELMDKITLQR
ncbi:MAG TPA: hypothetical protein VI815_00210 [Candidatus Nanoarchaeia archaeon]|nr:hypothetical protein [Candidatus Nanoarchaeia archaeon]